MCLCVFVYDVCVECSEFVYVLVLQYTHKFGASASVGATHFNYKLCPWGQRGWQEGSSRLYETKNYHLMTKIFHLTQL